jgi:uncharacterized Zn finger protein (UPF0148 family)
MTMKMSEHRILCAACKVEVGRREDGSVGCPKCGISDSERAVGAEVERHLLEIAQRRSQDLIKGVKGFKVTLSNIPRGRYRFISDLA